MNLLILFYQTWANTRWTSLLNSNSLTEIHISSMQRKHHIHFGSVWLQYGSGGPQRMPSPPAAELIRLLFSSIDHPPHQVLLDRSQLRTFQETAATGLLLVQRFYSCGANIHGPARGTMAIMFFDVYLCSTHIIYQGLCVYRPWSLIAASIFSFSLEVDLANYFMQDTKQKLWDRRPDMIVSWL